MCLDSPSGRLEEQNFTLLACLHIFCGTMFSLVPCNPQTWPNFAVPLALIFPCNFKDKKNNNSNKNENSNAVVIGRTHLAKIGITEKKVSKLQIQIEGTLALDERARTFAKTCFLQLTSKDIMRCGREPTPLFSMEKSWCVCISVFVFEFYDV